MAKTNQPQVAIEEATSFENPVQITVTLFHLREALPTTTVIAEFMSCGIIDLIDKLDPKRTAVYDQKLQGFTCPGATATYEPGTIARITQCIQNLMMRYQQQQWMSMQKNGNQQQMMNGMNPMMGGMGMNPMMGGMGMGMGGMGMNPMMGGMGMGGMGMGMGMPMGGMGMGMGGMGMGMNPAMYGMYQQQQPTDGGQNA